MNHFTVLHALIGGILIGFASLIATVLSGKVLGISGVSGQKSAQSFVPEVQSRAAVMTEVVSVTKPAASVAVLRPNYSNLGESQSR